VDKFVEKKRDPRANARLMDAFRQSACATSTFAISMIFNMLRAFAKQFRMLSILQRSIFSINPRQMWIRSEVNQRSLTRSQD